MQRITEEQKFYRENLKRLYLANLQKRSLYILIRCLRKQ